MEAAPIAQKQRKAKPGALQWFTRAAAAAVAEGELMGRHAGGCPVGRKPMLKFLMGLSSLIGALIMAIPPVGG
jgi:hypothetical protein